MFRGVFHIISGDSFTMELSDPSTDLFRAKSREFREDLNLIYRRSHLRSSFLGTEVLAFDGYVTLTFLTIAERKSRFLFSLEN